MNTYTPLEIDGTIWVVKNAPDYVVKTILLSKHDEVKKSYLELLKPCTKYPTLPSDAEYWKGRIGVPMQEGEIEFYRPPVTGFDATNKYAIPAKQNDDVWNELQDRFNQWLFMDGESSLEDIFQEFKTHYTLTKK